MSVSDLPANCFKLRDITEEAVSHLISVDLLDDCRTVVDTPCILPDGQSIQVYVSQEKGTPDRFRVEDCAQAMAYVRALGGVSSRPGIYFTTVKERFGIDYQSGNFRVRNVPLELIETAIVLVANASAQAAMAAEEALKLPKTTFLNQFDSFINDQCGDYFQKHLIAGKNKSYEKDYVHIDIKKGITVVEPVVPSPALDTVIADHLDMSLSDDLYSGQFVVYDEADEWGNAWLKRLQLIPANLLTYEQAQDALPNLVVNG